MCVPYDSRTDRKISLCRINRLACIMVPHSVLCKVGTDTLQSSQESLTVSLRYDDTFLRYHVTCEALSQTEECSALVKYSIYYRKTRVWFN